MSDDTKSKPEDLQDADLDNVTGGTITVEICHQIVGDSPKGGNQTKDFKKLSTTPKTGS